MNTLTYEYGEFVRHYVIVAWWLVLSLSPKTEEQQGNKLLINWKRPGSLYLSSIPRSLLCFLRVWVWTDWDTSVTTRPHERHNLLGEQSGQLLSIHMRTSDIWISSWLGVLFNQVVTTGALNINHDLIDWFGQFILQINKIICLRNYLFYGSQTR